MEHKGYSTAINMALERLDKCAPEDIVKNTGVIWENGKYIVPSLGRMVDLDSATIEEKIVFMHYMLEQGPKQPRNTYVNYKQIPGAAIYNANFVKRSIDPMVKVFGKDLNGFLEKGKMLGGVQQRLGHMSFTVYPLPYLPVTYVIWEGDEEIPASGNIIFDETAIEWLCAEDLVVIASIPVYMMMKL